MATFSGFVSRFDGKLNLYHLGQSRLPENFTNLVHRRWGKWNQPVVGPHLVKLVDNHGAAGLGQQFDGHSEPVGNVSATCRGIA